MRPTLAALGVVVFCAGLDAAENQPKPPKKADVPFTVHVFTEAKGSPEIMERIDDTTQEISKRIGKKKKWFRSTPSRDSAEITVEIVSHVINRQHVSQLDSRVNATGVGKSWVDTNYLVEHHYIEARVTLLGSQKMFTGHDERKRGGNMKRAADDLIKQIESYCQENYWELSEKRSSSGPSPARP